jgi:hypothetical protein
MGSLVGEVIAEVVGCGGGISTVFDEVDVKYEGGLDCELNSDLCA